MRESSNKLCDVRSAKTVFGEMVCSCPLPKVSELDENSENYDFTCNSTYQKKGLYFSDPPEIDANGTNGGCDSRKNTVCQEQRFHNPSNLR